MTQIPVDHAIRSDVEAAIRRGMTRPEIIKHFRGRASQASLYGWSARELERIAALPAQLPEDNPPVNVPTVSGGNAINYLDRLQANLSRLDAMLEIAVQEGRIRNTRLALEVTKEIGVQLTRAARIQADIQDVEGQQLFLRALADVIHEEEPEVRDRIIFKMRAIGASGGGM